MGAVLPCPPCGSLLRRCRGIRSWSWRSIRRNSDLAATAGPGEQARMTERACNAAAQGDFCWAGFMSWPSSLRIVAFEAQEERGSNLCFTSRVAPYLWLPTELTELRVRPSSCSCRN
jgi:hypothetical protein